MKAYRVIEDGLVTIISEGEWVTYKDDILFIDQVGDIMVNSNKYNTWEYKNRPCYRLYKMYHNQLSINSDASAVYKWVWKDINIIDIEFLWKGKKYKFNDLPNNLIEFDLSWDRNRKLEEIGI